MTFPEDSSHSSEADAEGHFGSRVDDGNAPQGEVDSVAVAEERSAIERSARDAAGARFSTRARIRRGIGWIVLFAVLVSPTQLASNYLLWVATIAFIYCIAVVGLNLILGYAGQISLAQAAFMGIGAYTVALTQDVITFWGALVLAATFGFVVGLGLGVPSLRVRHHYLAFVTLAFQITFEFVALNEDQITGGALGIPGIGRPTLGPIDFTSQRMYHLLVVILLMVVLLAAYWILNSQWGRAFKAIRENELRASTLGVNIRNYKLLAFAIGSSMAAVAGAMLAPAISYIDPTAFLFIASLEMLLMVIIGGSGRFEGPLIGALVVLGLPEFFRFSETHFLVMFALAGILMVIFMPKGLVTVVDYFFVKVLRRPAPRLSK